MGSQPSKVTRPPLPGPSTEIWDWKGVRISHERERLRTAIRKRGAVLALVGLLAGAIAARFFSAHAAAAVWGTSAVLAFSAIIGPQGAFVGVERVFKSFTKIVGRASNVLLLAPVHFLFLWPRGVLLRHRKKDPLDLTTDATRISYWKPRRGGTRQLSSYEKAF